MRTVTISVAPVTPIVPALILKLDCDESKIDTRTRSVSPQQLIVEITKVHYEFLRPDSHFLSFVHYPFL